MTSFPKSVVSLVTAFIFFSQSFSLAPQALAQSEINLKPSFDLQIPAELGSVDSIFSSSAVRQAPTIIHIQEAHGNIEGQKKIEGLLHLLSSRYGINTVLLEGTAFKLHPELANFYPESAKENTAVLENLLEKGIVTGPELFLAKNSSAQAFGIEEVEPYVANGAALKKVLQGNGEIDRFLSSLEQKIRSLCALRLNAKLRQFLKRSETLESQSSNAADRLQFLSKEAKETLQLDLSSPLAQFDWPMLVRVNVLSEMEKKFNQGEFEKQREKFLKEIFQSTVDSRQTTEEKEIASSSHPTAYGGVPSKGGNVGTPRLPAGQAGNDVIANAVKQSQESVDRGLWTRFFNESFSSPAPSNLETQIENLVASLPRDFDFKAYPQVNRFIGHKLLVQELKASQLMKEIETLTEKITDKLAKTKEEKEIVEQIKDYKLLKKLLNLELTAEEYEQIKKLEDGGKKLETAWQSFIPTSNFKPLSSALEFYRLAKERDSIMIRNIETHLKGHRTQDTSHNKILVTGDVVTRDSVVVITGGFHSKPFETYFKEHGYNYALISPKMSSVDGKESYQKFILNNFSPEKSSWKLAPRVMSTKDELALLGFNHRRWEEAGKNLQQSDRAISKAELLQALAASGAETRRNRLRSVTLTASSRPPKRVSIDPSRLSTVDFQSESPITSSTINSSFESTASNSVPTSVAVYAPLASFLLSIKYPQTLASTAEILRYISGIATLIVSLVSRTSPSTTASRVSKLSTRSESSPTFSAMMETSPRKLSINVPTSVAEYVSLASRFLSIYIAQHLASIVATLRYKSGMATLTASSTPVNRSSTFSSLFSTRSIRFESSPTFSAMMETSPRKLSINVPTSVAVYVSLASFLLSIFSPLVRIFLQVVRTLASQWSLVNIKNMNKKYSHSPTSGRSLGEESQAIRMGDLSQANTVLRSEVREEDSDEQKAWDLESFPRTTAPGDRELDFVVTDPKSDSLEPSSDNSERSRSEVRRPSVVTLKGAPEDEIKKTLQRIKRANLPKAIRNAHKWIATRTSEEVFTIDQIRNHASKNPWIALGANFVPQKNADGKFSGSYKIQTQMGQFVDPLDNRRNSKRISDLIDQLEEIRSAVGDKGITQMVNTGQGGSSSPANVLISWKIVRNLSSWDSTDPAVFNSLLEEIAEMKLAPLAGKKARDRFEDALRTKLQSMLWVFVAFGKTSEEAIVNLTAIQTVINALKIDGGLKKQMYAMTVEGFALHEAMKTFGLGENMMKGHLGAKGGTPGRGIGPTSTPIAFYPLYFELYQKLNRNRKKIEEALWDWNQRAILKPSETSTFQKLAAALDYYAVQKKKNKVTLILHPDLSGFAESSKQLVEESGGIKDKNLFNQALGLNTPTLHQLSWGTDDPAEIRNLEEPEKTDRVFLVVRVKDKPLTRAQESRISTLQTAGYDVLELEIESTRDLPTLLQGMHVTVSTLFGYLWKRNFVTQPQVENYKAVAKKMMLEAMVSAELLGNEFLDLDYANANSNEYFKALQTWRSMKLGSKGRIKKSPTYREVMGEVKQFIEIDGIQFKIYGPIKSYLHDLEGALSVISNFFDASIRRLDSYDLQPAAEILHGGDLYYSENGKAMFAALQKAATLMVRAPFKGVVHLGAIPVMNHEWHEGSMNRPSDPVIIFAPREYEKPRSGIYEPDYIQAQVAATVQAYRSAGKKVIVITYPRNNQKSRVAIETLAGQINGRLSRSEVRINKRDYQARAHRQPGKRIETYHGRPVAHGSRVNGNGSAETSLRESTVLFMPPSVESDLKTVWIPKIRKALEDPNSKISKMYGEATAAINVFQEDLLALDPSKVLAFKIGSMLASASSYLLLSQSQENQKAQSYIGNSLGIVPLLWALEVLPVEEFLTRVFLPGMRIVGEYLNASNYSVVRLSNAELTGQMLTDIQSLEGGQSVRLLQDASPAFATFAVRRDQKLVWEKFKSNFAQKFSDLNPHFIDLPRDKTPHHGFDSTEAQTQIKSLFNGFPVYVDRLVHHQIISASTGERLVDRNNVVAEFLAFFKPVLLTQAIREAKKNARGLILIGSNPEMQAASAHVFASAPRSEVRVRRSLFVDGKKQSLSRLVLNWNYLLPSELFRALRVKPATVTAFYLLNKDNERIYEIKPAEFADRHLDLNDNGVEIFTTASYRSEVRGNAKSATQKLDELRQKMEKLSAEAENNRNESEKLKFDELAVVFSTVKNRVEKDPAKLPATNDAWREIFKANLGNANLQTLMSYFLAGEDIPFTDFLVEHRVFPNLDPEKPRTFSLVAAKHSLIPTSRPRLPYSALSSVYGIIRISPHEEDGANIYEDPSGEISSLLENEERRIYESLNRYRPLEKIIKFKTSELEKYRSDSVFAIQVEEVLRDWINQYWGDERYTGIVREAQSTLSQLYRSTSQKEFEFVVAAVNFLRFSSLIYRIQLSEEGKPPFNAEDPLIDHRLSDPEFAKDAADYLATRPGFQEINGFTVTNIRLFKKGQRLVALKVGNGLDTRTGGKTYGSLTGRSNLEIVFGKSMIGKKSATIAMTDAWTGQPYSDNEVGQLITSGLSVGIPDQDGFQILKWDSQVHRLEQIILLSLHSNNQVDGKFPSLHLKEELDRLIANPEALKEEIEYLLGLDPSFIKEHFKAAGIHVVVSLISMLDPSYLSDARLTAWEPVLVPKIQKAVTAHAAFFKNSKLKVHTTTNALSLVVSRSDDKGGLVFLGLQLMRDAFNPADGKVSFSVNDVEGLNWPETSFPHNLLTNKTYRTNPNVPISGKKIRAGKEKFHMRVRIEDLENNFTHFQFISFANLTPRANIVPTPTFFKKDGEGKVIIDEEAVRAQLTYLKEKLGGNYTLNVGATGEFQKMDTGIYPGLRVHAIDATTRIAKEIGLVTFTGVTGDTEEETIANAKIAQTAGADSIVIAPLYYLKDSSEIGASIQRMRAAGITLPIALYNNPGLPKMAGKEIAADVVRNLWNKKLIFAIKNSGDGRLTDQYIGIGIPTYIGDESAFDEKSKFTGPNGEKLYGLVGSSGNFLPMFQEIAETQDAQRREALQKTINEIRPRLIALNPNGEVKHKIPQAIKYILSKINPRMASQVSLHGTPELTTEEKAEIDKIISTQRPDLASLFSRSELRKSGEQYQWLFSELESVLSQSEWEIGSNPLQDGWMKTIVPPGENGTKNVLSPRETGFAGFILWSDLEIKFRWGDFKASFKPSEETLRGFAVRTQDDGTNQILAVGNFATDFNKNPAFGFLSYKECLEHPDQYHVLAMIPEDARSEMRALKLVKRESEGDGEDGEGSSSTESQNGRAQVVAQMTSRAADRSALENGLKILNRWASDNNPISRQSFRFEHAAENSDWNSEDEKVGFRRVLYMNSETHRPFEVFEFVNSGSIKVDALFEAMFAYEAEKYLGGGWNLLFLFWKYRVQLGEQRANLVQHFEIEAEGTIKPVAPFTPGTPVYVNHTWSASAPDSNEAANIQGTNYTIQVQNITDEGTSYSLRVNVLSRSANQSRVFSFNKDEKKRSKSFMALSSGDVSGQLYLENVTLIEGVGYQISWKFVPNASRRSELRSRHDTFLQVIQKKHQSYLWFIHHEKQITEFLFVTLAGVFSYQHPWIALMLGYGLAGIFMLGIGFMIHISNQKAEKVYREVSGTGNDPGTPRSEVRGGFDDTGKLSERSFDLQDERTKLWGLLYLARRLGFNQNDVVAALKPLLAADAKNKALRMVVTENNFTETRRQADGAAEFVTIFTEHGGMHFYRLDLKAKTIAPILVDKFPAAEPKLGEREIPTAASFFMFGNRASDDVHLIAFDSARKLRSIHLKSGVESNIEVINDPVVTHRETVRTQLSLIHHNMLSLSFYSNIGISLKLMYGVPNFTRLDSWTARQLYEEESTHLLDFEGARALGDAINELNKVYTEEVQEPVSLQITGIYGNRIEAEYLASNGVWVPTWIELGGQILPNPSQKLFITIEGYPRKGKFFTLKLKPPEIVADLEAMSSGQRLNVFRGSVDDGFGTRNNSRGRTTRFGLSSSSLRDRWEIFGELEDAVNDDRKVFSVEVIGPTRKGNGINVSYQGVRGFIHTNNLNNSLSSYRRANSIQVTVMTFERKETSSSPFIQFSEARRSEVRENPAAFRAQQVRRRRFIEKKASAFSEEQQATLRQSESPLPRAATFHKKSRFPVRGHSSVFPFFSKPKGNKDNNQKNNTPDGEPGQVETLWANEVSENQGGQNSIGDVNQNFFTQIQLFFIKHNTRGSNTILINNQVNYSYNITIKRGLWTLVRVFRAGIVPLTQMTKAAQAWVEAQFGSVREANAARAWKHKLSKRVRQSLAWSPELSVFLDKTASKNAPASVAVHLDQLPDPNSLLPLVPFLLARPSLKLNFLVEGTFDQATWNRDWEKMLQSEFGITSSKLNHFSVRRMSTSDVLKQFVMEQSKNPKMSAALLSPLAEHIHFSKNVLRVHLSKEAELWQQIFASAVALDQSTVDSLNVQDGAHLASRASSAIELLHRAARVFASAA